MKNKYYFRAAILPMFLWLLAILPVQTSYGQAVTGPVGGNQPFSTVQPSLALNYIIAITGIFPSRDGYYFDQDAPYIGEIFLFAGNFAPAGYMFANGALLQIAQNTALFSILGTTYGGDGQTTFALPDLRGRIPVGMGQGPGLSQVFLGESGGSETVTLTSAQMVSHSHTLSGGGATEVTGGSQSFNNLQPYLGVNFVMAVGGIFPIFSEIRMFAGNFSPGGYFANGSLLSIAENEALFALLGTTYGGNGQTTFALPDLRGRVPAGAGNGPGLSPVVIGQQAGTPSVMMTINHLPSHAHTLSGGGNTNPAGNGNTIENRQPYLAIRYIICTSGLFPSQSGGGAAIPLLGQVRPYAAGWGLPTGWAEADGSLLQISTNQALFSILGTTYGGDGVTTFALPDLRGRVPVGAGSGPGLSSVPQGQRWGGETVTMTSMNLPSHTHTVYLLDGGEIADDQTICYGDVPSPFTSISPATGFIGDLEYKWQISTAIPTFDDIPGAVSETYTHVGELTQTTWFRRLAKGTSQSVWVESNVVQVTVNTTRMYVTQSGAGLMNGSSWANAMSGSQLQAAINASCVTEVWVAAGTYYPTSGTDRNISFSMKNDVAIYGGFSGTETQLSERNLAIHVTILSGDIGIQGDNSDNTYNVVRNNSSPLTNTAILNGFVIAYGNANGGNEPKGYGGGMNNSGSSPTIQNCIFRDNSCNVSGGGVYNLNCSPRYTNCIFRNNFSSQTGGGLYNQNSSTVLTNCTFSQNSAGSSVSGGISSSFSNISVTNCIIWGNSYGIFNFNSTSNVTYSLIQGGYAGTGNINTDPFFVSTNDLRLQPCSPAINAGSNASVPSGITTDLDGNPRFFNSGTIDMGAYEYQGNAVPGPVVYVNDNASGNNDGSSWTDAFTDLQDALALSGTCTNITEIWVAAGTYKPTSGTDRSISFSMINGVAIYGGFNGTETQLSERDWKNHVTILNGNIGSSGDMDDNSFHVIKNTGLNNNAVLDGFTISGGSANILTVSENGSGMYNQNSSPTVTNCIFTDNNAYNGAGMYNQNSSPKVTNCSFYGNMTRRGGGMYNEYSSPTVINCIFTGNGAADLGGGMYNTSSTPALTNCSFSGNIAAAQGGAMYNMNISFPTITNCIIWGNSDGVVDFSSISAVSYSVVQGGLAGTGNLDINPLFVNQPTIGLGTNFDLRLQPCSPAINAGSNASVPSGITTDLDGNPRFYISGTVDMGAYEYQGNAVSGPVIYVNDDASGNNDGTSWTDAFTDLQDALALAGTCSNISEIWVAAGTYNPTSGTDRTISFSMKHGVSIYGGFGGTETLLSQRDWLTHETILSGDIGVAGDFSDNSYRIVDNNNNGLDNNDIMDGFTITASMGQCCANNNGGGGMRNRISSPTVSNCRFIDNSAFFGAGMVNENSSAFIVNCSFITNNAYQNGGGLNNWAYTGNTCNPTIVNCVFYDNSAADGGAIMNILFTPGNCSPEIINCSFFGNSAGSAADGISNNRSTPVISNSILWGNGTEINTINGASPSVTNSIVQGGYTGTGNLDADPLYIDATNMDLHLQPCSPAINAGDNTAVPSGTTTDLDGDPRFYNSGTVDMGAFEYQAEKPTNPTDGGEIASSQDICANEIPAAFTSVNLPSGYVGNLEYQWRKSTTGASSGFGDISGANSATFAETAALTETTWYKRLSRNDCKTNWTDAAESNVVEITVEQIPISGTLVKTPDVSNVCEGTDVSATLTAGSGGNGTDQNEYRTHNGTSWSGWATYISGTNISTADKTQVEIQTLRQADYCNDATANTVSWIIEQTPVSGTLTKSPDVANVCEGTDVSATFTAGSGGNGTDQTEYRTHNGTSWSGWATYTSGTDISTSDITQVEIQTLRQADYCSDATANTVSWTVDPTTVAGSIGGSSSITYGSSTGNLTLTGNIGAIQKWQKRPGTSGAWTDISHTSATYSETPSSAGTWQYRVLVQSGTCGEEYTEPHGITVEPKELSIGGSFTANDKIYDDNTDATFDANDLELTGVVGTDDVTLTGLEIDFASKTVGEHTVNITAATLDGADKDNYTLTLTGSPETTATINAGPPVRFLVTNPEGGDITSPKLHNIPFDVKVTLVDAYDNPTPNTGGNVTITLTGSGGATPGDLRFQGFPADPVTQTLNAGDTISDFDNVLYTGVSAVAGFDVKVSATAAGTGTANGKTGESNLFSVRDIFFSVEADPTSILADGTTKTDITVTLKDHDNNPIPNQTITVETDKGTLMEGLVELTGVVSRNTDANGQVFLQLRSENASALATVTAKCPGACPQTVQVAFILNAPVITGFTPGEEQVTIDFNPPTNPGLTTISNYEYSLDDGGNWTAFSPAQTGSPVTITGLMGGQTYLAKLRAVNEAGIGAASDAEEVYSCYNPTGGGEIGNDQSINNCETPLALTSITPASGHFGTLEYQWQSSTTSASDGFSNIGGATLSTYQPEALNDTTWYRRLARVSCKPDWTEAVSSNVVKITVKFVQTIQIPQGWSYISSYLEPTNPNIVNMWADIVGENNLAILTGVSGIYAPAPFYINTLNNWDVNKGYKVKMNATDELQVNGVPLSENTVNFAAGVHLIPVLTNQTTGLDEVFNDPATDILYMLDLYQNLVYWPGGGINTLTELVPGTGYLGNFKNPVTLTYPPLGDCSKSKSQLLPPTEGPWPVVRTSNYHLISVSTEAISQLQNADYIGAFDSQGNCVGYSAIEKSGSNLLLTVYGDEPMTAENDGITEGELLHFRSFSINENDERELTATFSQGYPYTDGLFYINGLSGINGFKESATGVGENELANEVQVYPNPTRDVVNVVFTGLQTIEGFGILMTAEGKVVKTFTIASPETQLNVEDLQPGIYLLKLETEKAVVIKRVVIQ